MRDNKGQLLLLAVVFLAITLIVLASAATIFLNVKQSPIINESLAVEYGNVKEKFGYALNKSANQTYQTYMAKGYTPTPENVTLAINDGFYNTTRQFEILLSYHGINFDAKLEEITPGAGQWWNANVTLTMSNRHSFINETVVYSIWL